MTQKFNLDQLEAQVIETLAAAGIDYHAFPGKPFCSPVKNSGPAPGGSLPVLESIPLTSTIQSFESWVEQLGNLYRAGSAVDCCEWSPHVAQMLNARSLLDEYRAFAAVCHD